MRRQPGVESLSFNPWPDGLWLSPFPFFAWPFPNFYQGGGDEPYPSQPDPLISISCVLPKETRSRSLSPHCGEDSPGFRTHALIRDTSWMKFTSFAVVKCLNELKGTHVWDLLGHPTEEIKQLKMLAKSCSLDPHIQQPFARECIRADVAKCEILVFKAILFLFMICRYFIHMPALEKRLPLWYPLTQPTIQLFHEVLKLVEQKQCVKY